jgi:hypothetical protein
MTSEDVTVLKGLQSLVGAEVQGDAVNATTVEFFPKHRPRPQHLALRIADQQQGQVPGNALVVAEALAPVLARSGALSSVHVI